MDQTSKIDAVPLGRVATLWHVGEKGDTKVLHILLSKGAKVDVQTPGGSTTIYCAAVRQDPATTSAFLQYGATVNASPWLCGMLLPKATSLYFGCC